MPFGNAIHCTKLVSIAFWFMPIWICHFQIWYPPPPLRNYHQQKLYDILIGNRFWTQRMCWPPDHVIFIQNPPLWFHGLLCNLWLSAGGGGENLLGIWFLPHSKIKIWSSPNSHPLWILLACWAVSATVAVDYVILFSLCLLWYLNDLKAIEW